MDWIFEMLISEDILLSRVNVYNRIIQTAIQKTFLILFLTLYSFCNLSFPSSKIYLLSTNNLFYYNGNQISLLPSTRLDGHFYNIK